MDKKTRKWLRCAGAAGLLLLIGTLALFVNGSLGAYTNLNSVKRVVSTGTQSDTMFGSNYLSLVSSVDTDYSIKRISLDDSKEEMSFTVVVSNYAWGDEKRYNPKDISYTVTAQLLSVDGGSLPEDISGITINDKAFDENGTCVLEGQTLRTGSASRNEYKFVLPSTLKNKIKIQMTAEALGDSVDAVNSKKLAAILSFADYVTTKTWTGHFIDSTDKAPGEYDAFNYEISGNGAGTVTVTWPESLQLSKWATGGIQMTGTYSFVVSDDVTSIQFQFYRNPDNPLNLTSMDSKAQWDELEKMIKVTFTDTEKVDENDKTQN